MTRPSITRIACSTLLAGALLGAAAVPAGAAVTTSAHQASAPAQRHATTVTHKRVSKKVTHKHVTKKKAVKATAKANLTTFESELLADINNARHAAGVGPLTASPGTTDVARRWTLTLVQNDALSHNPDLTTDAQNAGSNAWTWLGENVGTGPANDESDLFAAYMASPHHRDNILDPRARYIGIGVIQVTDAAGDQVAYNTCDFTDAYATSYGADKTPALGNVVSVAQATSALAG